MRDWLHSTLAGPMGMSVENCINEAHWCGNPSPVWAAPIPTWGVLNYELGSGAEHKRVSEHACIPLSV